MSRFLLQTKQIAWQFGQLFVWYCLFDECSLLFWHKHTRTNISTFPYIQVRRISTNRAPQFTRLHLTMSIIEKLFPFIIECTLHLIYILGAGVNEKVFFSCILTVVYGTVNLAPLTLKFQMKLPPGSAWRIRTNFLGRKWIPKVFEFVFE